MAKNNVNVANVTDNKANVLNMDLVTSKLSEALTVSTDSFFTTLDSGAEISQKEYQLINPIGKKERITVYDVAIIESMEKISASLKGKDILSYVICKELANIQSTGKLENMGFKNIAEFGKAVYGFEASTTNHYTKIGNSFINSDYSVKKGLPQLSVSHLIELNSLVGEDGDISGIINLYVDGTLIDGMSTKKMRETLKTLKNGNTIEDKSTNSDNSANSGNSAETTNNSESSATTTDNTASVQPDVINLEKSFDIKVAIAQILSHCNAINEIFGIMSNNGHEVGVLKSCTADISEIVKKML